MAMKIKTFFSFLLACLIAFSATAAELNISADKTVLTEGDTLSLTINYTGDDSGKPDLSNLSKDFQVVSVSSSRQVQYINGAVSQLKSWTVQLKPLVLGKITIKPVSLGNLVSNYLEVEVKEVTNVAYIPDSRENSNSPYFQIEQTFDNKKPYLQQQVVFVVTIYDSLGLQDGALSINEEAKDNWIIKSLSQKPFVQQKVINNKKMNVLQFAFAAFPQKSGEIDVPQFAFEGYYLKNTDFDFPNFNDSFMIFGVDFKNAFGQKVPVNMKTSPQKITVLPAVATATGQMWLPLTDLKLSAHWQNSTAFKVGDALRREFTITATGLPQTMIPTLNFADIKGLKQYPEKPEVTESIANGQIVSTAKINNVYIPTDVGDFVLPPIEIEWFNIQTKQFEKAVIPAETIQIFPNEDFVTKTPYEETSPVLSTSNQETNSQTSLNESPRFFKFQFNSTLLWAILSGLLVLSLFFKYLVYAKRQNIYRDNVITAMQKHNYSEAKNSLILWARHKFNQPDISNFNMIIDVVNNEDFKQELSALNKLLYSGSEQIFNSARFIKIFKNVDKIKITRYKDNKVLPNLYD